MAGRGGASSGRDDDGPDAALLTTGTSGARTPRTPRDPDLEDQSTIAGDAGLEDQTVSILNVDKKKYVTVRSTGQVDATSARVSDWERFKLHYNEDDTVSFKSPRNKYIVVGNQGELLAESAEIIAEAKFDVLHNEDGSLSFKSYQGRYVGVADLSGTLMATSSRIGPADKFKIHSLGISMKAKGFTRAELEVAAQEIEDPRLQPGNVVLCPVSRGSLVRAYVMGVDSRRGYLVVELALDKPQEIVASGQIEQSFGPTWSGHPADCRPTNSVQELLNKSDDLANLEVVSEEAVVDALRWRWLSKQCTTFAKSTLLTLDVGMGLLSQKATGASGQVSDALTKISPGIGELCSRALRTWEVSGRAVTFVLHGPTGAGKTTVSRHITEKIVDGSSGSRRQGATQSTVGRVLSGPAQVLVEAFSSAKTSSNDNSSRAGLFWQLWPLSAGDIGGAKVTACSLEVSRVVTPPPGERSFHVFYEMLHGLTPKECDAFGLLRPEMYKCLRTSGGELQLADDVRGFSRFAGALRAINIGDDTAGQVFRALGGILACSNVAWVDADGSQGEYGETIRCSSVEDLERVAQGLGVPFAELHRLLGAASGRQGASGFTGRRLPTGISETEVARQEATSRTEALARGVYTAVFGWLLARLNKTLGAVTPSPRWIGILDFCGFEINEVNTLDQLIVNQTGEMLHQLFIERRLKDQLSEVLQLEGEHAEYTDNVSSLQLVDGSFSPGVSFRQVGAGSARGPLLGGGRFNALQAPNGVVQILDESCENELGSDKDFSLSCHSAFRSHSHFSAARETAASRFCIAHAFQPVEYTATGFRERNLATNSIDPAIVELLRTSSNEVVQDAFQLLEDPPEQPQQGMAMRRLEESKRLIAKAASATSIQFVKCLRVNRKRSSTRRSSGAAMPTAAGRPPLDSGRNARYEQLFDWEAVVEACRGMGIFEEVRLTTASGFPYIMPHLEFLADYPELTMLDADVGIQGSRGDPQRAIQQFFDRKLPHEVAGGTVKVGPTMTMMKYECYELVKEQQEEAKESVLAVAEVVQHLVKERLDERSLKRSVEQVLMLQSRARRRLELKHEFARTQYRRELMGGVKLLQAVTLLRPRREAALTMQASLRTMVAKKQFNVHVLQRQLKSAWSCYHARRLLSDLAEESLALLSWTAMMETLAARLEFTHYNMANSSNSIQSAFRGIQARKKTKELQKAKEAKEALGGVVQCLNMRLQLAKEIFEAAGRTFQDKRKKALIIRDTNFKIKNRQSLDVVVGAARALHWRLRLLKPLMAGAVTNFQKRRRGVEGTRKFKETKTKSSAQNLVLGALQTALWRQRLIVFGSEYAGRGLQRTWRGKKGRDKYETIQQESGDWSIVVRTLQTLVMRRRQVLFTEFCAAQCLQNFARIKFSRRKMAITKVRRLQELLLRQTQRLRARLMLESLRATSFLALQVEEWSSFGHALAWRAKFAKERELACAIKIQRFVRWFINRRQSKELYRSIATHQVVTCCKRYMAQRLMYKLRSAQQFREARLTWQRHVDIALWRMYFSYTCGREVSARLLQRVGRGYIVRKRVRLIKWEREAVAGIKILRRVWKKYVTQAAMIQIKDEDLNYVASSKLADVVRTLQWRAAAEFQVHNYRRIQAQTTISKFVRGRRVRRQPEIQKVMTIISWLRREQQDRQFFELMDASMKLQKQWRANNFRTKALLPRLIERLGAERRGLVQAHDRESMGLSGLNSKRPWSGAGSHLADISVLSSTVASVPGWRESMEYAQREGGTLIDFALGAEHGFVVCATGHAYFFNVEIKSETERRVGDPVQITFHDKFPGSCYSLAVQMLPKITRAVCGVGHVLFLTDQGLVYGWGLNLQGQCGIGDDKSPLGKLEIVPELMCLQDWSTPMSKGQEPDVSHKGNIGMPRVRMCACGPSHSGAIDVNGALWLWGSSSGICLPTMVSTAPLPKKDRVAWLAGHTPFILFKHVKEPSVSRFENKTIIEKAWQRNTLKDTIPEVTRANMFHARSKPVVGEADIEIDEDRTNLTKTGVIRGIHTKPLNMDGTRSEASETVKTMTLTVDQMIENAMEEFPSLKELPGNLHSPTLCAQLVSGEAPDMKFRTSGQVTSFLDASTGRVAVVSPAKGRFSPFEEVFMSQKVNFVRCDRNFLYSFGPADQPMLGRSGPKTEDDTKSAAIMTPARLPIFVQMSTSVQTLAIGGIHVVALTCHGRVYTWGEQEACLDTRGFYRHTFRDPAILGGALERVRVTRVGAGRVDTACQIEGIDTILGWELLEASVDGRKLEPACYQFTLTGPRFGPRSGDTRGGRMTMVHSEALQILLVQDMGGGGGGTGRQPPPPGVGRWGKDGEQGRRGPAAVASHGLDLSASTRKAIPSSPGEQDADRRRLHAVRSPNTVLARNFSRNTGNVLFEWAKQSQELRPYKDFEVAERSARLFDVGAKLTMVRREPVELSRDILLLRRLAQRRGLPTSAEQVNEWHYRNPDQEEYEPIASSSFSVGNFA